MMLEIKINMLHGTTVSLLQFLKQIEPDGDIYIYASTNIHTKIYTHILKENVMKKYKIREREEVPEVLHYRIIR